MTSTLATDIDQNILVEAAHWCLRLQDAELTAQERLAFQHWVQLDPQHAFEYARMLELWELTGRLPEDEKAAQKLLLDAAVWQGR